MLACDPLEDTVPAFVEHSFKRGFLLDETRLRKLKDIIETREGRNSHQKLSYVIYRGDSYYYTTESVDDVVKEDNEDWRQITRLDIKIPSEESDAKQHSPRDMHFMLSFSGKRGCDLRIASDDRDRVFLLFSDLRDYIQHEVTVTRKLDRDTFRFVGLLLSMILLLSAAAAMLSFDHPSPEGVKHALSSTEIATKLDFLIQQRTTQSPSAKTIGGLALGVTLSFVSLFGGLSPILRFLFPGNEFLFGKRKERFEKRQRLTNNLLWVVGVGLVVSVAAGFIVWRVTLPH